jgi:hypothetical protein
LRVQDFESSASANSATPAITLSNHAAEFHASVRHPQAENPRLVAARGTYYAQLRIDLGNGRTAPRRIALKATNLDEVMAQMDSQPGADPASMRPCSEF